MSTASRVEGPTRTATQTRDRRLGAIALVVVGGVLPLLVAQHFGAFGIPRNDDWAYSRAAFALAEHGTVDGGHWIATNLVGQLVASLPIVWVFGRSLRALQLATVVTGVVGLFALRSLAMHLVSARRALFAAVLVAVGPMWASLAVSSMTDVPAFALAMLCLALAASGVRRDRLTWTFWASLAVGLFAFTIREYAIVAPVAVLATAMWTGRSWPRPRRGAVVVATVGFLVAAVAFYVWRLGLPNWYETKLRMPTATSLGLAQDVTARFAMLFGVLVSPALIASAPLRAVRTSVARAPRTTFVTLGLLVVWFTRVIVHRWSSAWFLGRGNYVSADGTLGSDTLPGVRRLLIGRPLLVVAAVIGLCSVLVLVCLLISAAAGLRARIRAEDVEPGASPASVLVGLAALGYAGGFLLSDLLALHTFDRYLLPLVPLVAILLLARTTGSTPSEARRNRVGAVVALVALAAIGAVYAVNSASYDGTRWRVAEEALRVAGHAGAVDGGYEWIGFHGHYHTFRAHDACVKITAQLDEPSPGDRAVLSADSVWGPLGPQTWIVARKTGPC